MVILTEMWFSLQGWGSLYILYTLIEKLLYNFPPGCYTYLISPWNLVDLVDANVGFHQYCRISDRSWDLEVLSNLLIYDCWLTARIPCMVMSRWWVLVNLAFGELKEKYGEKGDEKVGLEGAVQRSINLWGACTGLQWKNRQVGLSFAEVQRRCCKAWDQRE